MRLLALKCSKLSRLSLFLGCDGTFVPDWLRGLYAQRGGSWMRYQTWVTCVGLQRFFTIHPKILTHVHLGHIIEYTNIDKVERIITEQVLRSLSEHPLEALSLTINKKALRGFKHLLRNSPNLKHLALDASVFDDDRKKIMETFLSELSMNESLASRLRTLDFGNKLLTMGDVDIEKLVKLTPNLTLLLLHQDQFADNLRMDKIHQYNNEGSHLADVGLRMIGESLRNLPDFDISGRGFVGGITFNGILEFSRLSPQLEMVGIKGVYLTYDQIDTIVQALPR